MEDRQKSRYPRYLQKCKLRFLPFMLLALAILVGGAVIRWIQPATNPPTESRWFPLGVLIPGYVIGLVSTFLFHREKRRLQKRIKECDYMVCTDCAYSLVGIGSSGKCPECGVVFDEQSLRETWRYFENNLLLL